MFYPYKFLDGDKLGNWWYLININKMSCLKVCERNDKGLRNTDIAQNEWNKYLN